MWAMLCISPLKFFFVIASMEQRISNSARDAFSPTFFGATTCQATIRLSDDRAPMVHRVFAARVATYQQMLEPLRSREQVLIVERAQAQKALEEAQHHLQQVDAEIADICARANDLEDSINRVRWHLDPRVMQNFPTELLRAVFLELADDMHQNWTWEDKFTYYVVPKSVVPFVLASVCRRWRQLALDTSALWSFVAVPPPSSKEDAEKALRYTRTLVERSGSSPVDGVITWPKLAWENMSGPCYSIVSVLASVAPRWRRISVDLPDGTDVELFDCFRRQTPLLEEISTWYRTPYFRLCPYTTDPDTPQYLPYCPRLRKFRTSRCNIIFSAPRHSLAHLTQIQIWSDLSASAVWGILHLVPAVEELDIWLQSRLGALEPSPGSQLDLPALQRLTCCHFAATLFEHWANFLNAPRVSHVELELIHGNEDDNRESVENLLRRLSGSVVSLKLVDGWGRMTAQRTAELAPLRNLRTVDLHGWFEPAFFERLVDDRAWPDLEAMSIDPSDNEDLTEVARALLKFVRSRTVELDSPAPGDESGQLAPLASFSLVEDSCIPEWVSEQIAQYITP